MKRITFIAALVAVVSSAWLGFGCGLTSLHDDVEKTCRDAEKIMDESARVRREVVLAATWRAGRSGIEWSDFTGRYHNVFMQAMKSRHE